MNNLSFVFPKIKAMIVPLIIIALLTFLNTYGAFLQYQIDLIIVFFIGVCISSSPVSFAFMTCGGICLR